MWRGRTTGSVYTGFASMDVENEEVWITAQACRTVPRFGLRNPLSLLEPLDDEAKALAARAWTLLTLGAVT